MSFDQATTKTGIAIHENNKLVVYDYVNLEKKKIEISERVCVMGDILCGIIRKNKPNYVVIEDVALQSNALALIYLARLQGFIVGYCREHKIPCKILMPPSWRKALGFKQGKGVPRPQLKKQAVEYVLTNYGLKLNEDVCEAVCIGDAFLKMNNIEK